MQQAQLLMVFLTFVSETYPWNSQDMQDIELDKATQLKFHQDDADLQMDSEFDYLDFVSDVPEHREDAFFANYGATQHQESEEQTVFLSFKKQK